eukprot:CAMPEP_0116126888 /NCGR_PEP_ID=MMETSP0329-20121206/6561_1 /TAXON_ID=697910 /ORGANISM="Pseudo-nitzschia arenysensis, Strain B593" /LENGTH=489 /DNA_ID=CAMNT_0003620979 /DNA_START=72 /DNA_END=1538 /DNA_ORIENTATION=+
MTTKGNDGSAARRRTIRKLIVSIVVALGLTLLLIHNSEGPKSTSIHHGKHDDDGDDDDRLGNNERPRRRHNGHHESPDDEGDDDDDDHVHVDIGDDGGNSRGKKQWDFDFGLAAKYRKELIGHRNTDKRAEVLEGILNGSVNLVDIANDNVRPSTDGSYEGLDGKFCKLNFAVHKSDPSNHPMFRFMVQESPECQGPNVMNFDISKVAYLARMRDEEFQDADTGPKVLNLTAVAFHESRCGSTLVANSMIAMNPEKHRTYSESSPPIKAFHTCGDNFGSCTEEQAVKIFQDTVYLMSRTDDHREERVFYKFQSATSRKISIFQKAFPEVPWMYIYRDPVQVMMSHVKDDTSLKRAICTKTRRHPPQDIQDIAKRHGRANADALEPAEYCAAHLAQLTESAVRNLNEMAIPVDYEQLPDILWEKIMPRIFGRDLEPFEVDNLKKISGVYSKGTNTAKKGEFKGDSEQKEKKASEEVKKAAKEFLTESFDR